MKRKVSKKQKLLLIKFMRQLKRLVNYWEKVPRANLHDRLNGLVFSILAEIDGVGELRDIQLKDITSGLVINYPLELHAIWNAFDWDKLYEETTKEKNKQLFRTC